MSLATSRCLKDAEAVSLIDTMTYLSSYLSYDDLVMLSEDEMLISGAMFTTDIYSKDLFGYTPYSFITIMA